MLLHPMTSAEVDEKTNLTQLEAIWQQIRQRLQAEKERIVEEIGYYRPPIRACDAQFNGLLEDRAAILQQIGQVQGILKQSLTLPEHLQLLNDFMQSSHYLDREVEEKIRQLIPTSDGNDAGR